MRRVFVLATIAALVASAGSSRAQDKPDKGPAVEIRLKSVNDLLDYFEYVGGIVGQEEQAKQAAGLVRAIAGPKGIEGVDPTKPFGVYASVTQNVADSPVVAMIPIADEDTFLGLLRTRLNLDPKKGDDGVYQMDVPNIPPTIYFRIANGYLYATIRDNSAIAKKNLIEPKTFFQGNDPAVLSAIVHVDRIPAEVRKFVFGRFEMALNEEKEKKTPGDSSAQHKLKGILLDGTASAVNTLLTDGRTLTVRLLVAPKQDELAVDITLTAASGSDLAKSLQSVAGRKGLAPTAARVSNPVLAVAMNFGLPPAMVAKLQPIVDDLIKQSVASAKPDDQVGAQKVLDALAPTFKAGQFEIGVAMSEANGTGKYKLVTAMRTKDGTEIDKVARELLPFLTVDKVKAEFDAQKLAGTAVHKLTVPNKDMAKLFGTDVVWAMAGDEIFVVSVEPDAAEAKRVATGSPAGGEVIRVEVAAAAAANVFEQQLPPAKIKEIVNEAFEGKSPKGQDTIKLIVNGGEKLTARLMIKGRAVKLLATLDQARKAKE